MRATADARQLLADGFAAIRAELGLVGDLPAEVEAAAAEAALRPLAGDRVDARHLELVTLDPATSRDLDQAFALAVEGDDLVLSYAIADVGAFVPRGGPVDAEAWRRGVTVYAPDGRRPLYPDVLGQGAASLLPDGDRPAVLLTVAVDPEGVATLRSTRRALVRSRAKLAYETVGDTDLPPALAELAARVHGAEAARGAQRIDFPAPEIVADPSAPGGFVLRAVPRRPAEDLNATLSLAANLAVAARMVAAGVGLFRVMPDPPEARLPALRRSAAALGIAWPREVTLRRLAPTLDPSDPRQAAFLRAVRQAGGGATYATASAGPPWHGVIAAAYSHATAPLRRLADRYVLELLCELEATGEADATTVEALDRLPAVMEAAETLAARVEREAVDLVEAVILRDRVGDEFEATVVDGTGDRARIQLADPPVRSSVEADGVEPGQRLRVRLVEADPDRRRLAFTRSAAPVRPAS